MAAVIRLVPWCAVLVLACGAPPADEKPPPEASERTFECTTDPEPVRIVGIDGAFRDFQFGDITSAVVVNGRRIVVADRMLSRIALIDLEGDRVEIVGRPGPGPGEFLDLRAVVPWKVDTLLAFDRGNRRLTAVHAATGAVVGTFPMAGDLSPLASLVGAPRDTVLMFLEPRPSRTRTGWIQDTLDLTRYSIDGERLGHVASVPGVRRYMDLETTFNVWLAPFATGPSVVLLDSLVAVATGDRPEAYLLNESGDTLRAIELPSSAGRVTGAMRNSFEEEVRSTGGGPALRGFLRALRYPNSTPHFGRLVADRVGGLWVEDFLQDPASPGRAVAVDGSGQPAEAVPLRPGASILDANQELLVLQARTEEDVPIIQVLRRTCD